MSSKNNESELLNANFKINHKLWKRFKDQAKFDNSDAYKIIRGFIIKYLKYNENLSKH